MSVQVEEDQREGLRIFEICRFPNGLICPASGAAEASEGRFTQDRHRLGLYICGSCC